MTRPSWRARLAALAAATLWPAIAQACPFCFSGSPRVRMAFFLTTILLSLLPLAMIGIGIAWVVRSGRFAAPGEFEESDYSAGDGAGQPPPPAQHEP